MFYLAKSMAGQYERTPEIREKCHQTHLKDHRGLGVKRSETTKKRISEAKKRYWAEMTIEQKRERLDSWIPKKGRKAWNKGLRSKKYYEAEIARNSLEYSDFRKKCFERDLYSCCISGQKGGNLVVHHVYSFSDYPEIRFLIDNGVTMSKEKHNEFHSVYGKKHNNLDQLLSFIGG